MQEIFDLPEGVQDETLTDFESIFLENGSFQYDDGDEDVLLDVHRQAALVICDYTLHIEEGHIARFESVER